MAEPATIDPRQEATIARVHHGFLFQHVLAACLVARHATSPYFSRLVVEKDEDIEVVCDRTRHYIQVKVETALTFSELYREILRLHELRMLHVQGPRDGICRLYLVSGETLGEELSGDRGADAVLEKVRALARKNAINDRALVETWQSITFVVPGESFAELGNTPVRLGVLEQLDILTGLLSQITRLANTPIASAYALATSMNALAADVLRGFSLRSILASDTPRLIETIHRRVEVLPDLPKFFVPLPLGVDAFGNGCHVLLIGSSGCGKTSQLSYLAAQASLVTIYLRPVDASADAVDDDLVLQLHNALMHLVVAAPLAVPASAGIPAFEAVGYLVAAIPSSVVVIVDDAHVLPPTPAVRQFVRELVRRHDVCLALVAQPSRPDGQVTTTFLQSIAGASMPIVDVPGWGFVETSAYLQRRQFAADPFLAERIRQVSGGSPIAVSALLDVCNSQFNGNLERMLVRVAQGAIDPSVHGIISAQYRALPRVARQVAAVIALTRLPRPTLADIEYMLTTGEARAGVAYLRENRIILQSGDTDRFELHQLYLSVAGAFGGEVFDDAEVRAMHAKAVSLLRRKLRDEGLLDLSIPLLLNEALAGDVSGVVGQLTQEGEFGFERLQRVGLGTPAAGLIDQLLPLSEGEDRFWLLDALVFLNIAEDLRRNEEELWQKYSHAYANLEDPARTTEISFNLKSMRHYAMSGDLGGAGAAWYAAQKLVEPGSEASIVTSEYASALWSAGDLDHAWLFAQQALEISTRVIGIDPALLWSQNDCTHVLALARVPDISRLADNIELLGYILESFGDNPIPMFSRSAYIFDYIRADKSARKSEHRLCLNQARERRRRQEVRHRLEYVLHMFRRNGFVGALLDVTAALVAICRLMNDTRAADAYLESMSIFDQNEVNEEIASAMALMSIPLESSRALEFYKRHNGGRSAAATVGHAQRASARRDKAVTDSRKRSAAAGGVRRTPAVGDGAVAPRARPGAGGRAQSAVATRNSGPRDEGRAQHASEKRARPSRKRVEDGDRAEPTTATQARPTTSRERRTAEGQARQATRREQPRRSRKPGERAQAKAVQPGAAPTRGHPQRSRKRSRKTG